MSGIAAFIAGLGTGYVNGSRYADEQDRLKKKDEMDKETHDAQMQAAEDAKTERKQKLANEKLLRDAAAPVDVKEGAAVTGLSTDGNAAQYSDPAVAASDVRQATTMADATGTQAPATTVAPKFAAGGINFDSQAQAQTAATAANDPAARQARMQTAMERTGDYAGGATLKLSDLKTKEAQQTLADNVWKHDLGAAMQSGHDGLARLVSSAEAGPMAGKTVKPVPSPDGATVTYNLVGADGAMTPTSLTFPAGPDGVMQAAYMLDRTVSPANRVEHAIKTAKTEAEVKELTAKAGYWEANGQKQAELAKNGGSAGKKADHFDEKEWNNASKIDKATVSLPNAFGDKDVESGDLRSAYLQVFNSAKASGDYSPNEAVEHATTTVVRLKNAAQARVEAAKAADPKTTLTVDKAVRDIVKEAAKRAATQPAAASPTQIPPAVQAGRDTEAGVQMIKSDYKGNVEAAKVDAAQLQQAIKQAKGDGKSILQSHLNRLLAGINAMSQQAPPVRTPVAAAGIPRSLDDMAGTPMYRDTATRVARGVDLAGQ